MSKRIIFLFLFFYVSNGYGQANHCDTCYNDDLIIISADQARAYRGNYASIYRKSDVLKKMYSESVEFSRTQLRDFFDNNSWNWYCGFNIYFVNSSDAARPGRGSFKQIGLALVPRDKEGLPDFGGHLIENIAFDRVGGHGGRGSRRRQVQSDAVMDGKTEYGTNFPNLADTVHTKYVLVGESTAQFLKDFVFDDTNKEYETYRFYFMVYTSDSLKICGLSHPKQIGIFIAPVGIDGERLEVFGDYLKKYKMKKPNFKSINHGSLCPNYCPDGDY